MKICCNTIIIVFNLKVTCQNNYFFRLKLVEIVNLVENLKSVRKENPQVCFSFNVIKTKKKKNKIIKTIKYIKKKIIKILIKLKFL